jgi:hypothetical protein
MFCYIINYFLDNNFYKKDILQCFKGKKPEYNLVFDAEYEDIEIQDIKIKKTKSIFEINSPEYHKCNYSEDITLYINEYNIILSSKNELAKNEILNIINPDYPLIIFFY